MSVTNEMLENMEYPRPAFTADVVALRFHGGYLEVLLIERGHDPFKGHAALPGGFVEKDERADHAALRELQEETGLTDVPLAEIGVFAGPDRDPRGWTVTSAWLGFVPEDARPAAGDDAAALAWHRVTSLPPLAFDHADVIRRGLERLRELTQTSTLPLALLPRRFRTAQARHLYAQILGHPLKPGQFKAWLRRREVVERTGPARFQRRPELRPDWCR